MGGTRSGDSRRQPRPGASNNQASRIVAHGQLTLKQKWSSRPVTLRNSALIQCDAGYRSHHIVLISALGADAVEQSPLRIIERHVMASGVPYTILRPNFFMENFSIGFLAPMVKQGGIFLAAADGKTSFISTVDIAAVAVTAFLKGLASKEYNLTGPEALDHTAVATLLSRASGKKITYQAIPEDAMLSGMRGSGMPESAVQYAGMLYSAVRAGYTAGTTPDVEMVTGKRPISFQAFAQQNAAAWA